MNRLTGLDGGHLTVKDRWHNPFVVERPAGGVTLSRLCETITRDTAAHEYVDIRRPGEEYERPTAVSIVQGKQARKMEFIRRGISPARMNIGLSNLVPSLLRGATVQATSLEIDESAGHEYYISLGFDVDDANKLRAERRAAWRVLSHLGGFPVRSLPWIEDAPDVRLAYIPSRSGASERERLRDSISETIDAVLPFEVHLAAVYEQPLTAEAAALV